MNFYTLKDLETTHSRSIIFNELREVVIEQIKSGYMVEGAKFWAIKFFNLEEEDLI